MNACKSRHGPGVIVSYLAVLVLLTGCMPQIVYKPSSLVAEKPLVPLRVAVQPFKDATDDAPPDQTIIFFKSTRWMNLARSSQGSAYVPLMPPEFWSKAVASELRHSGLFADVTQGSVSDGEPPDLLIEGSVLKAEAENKAVIIVIFPVYFSGRQEYGLHLRARRVSDRKILWERRVERSISKAMTSGDKTAAVVQSMLVEAIQDLTKTLQANPPSRITAPGAPAAGGTNDSVEDILKRITH